MFDNSDGSGEGFHFSGMGPTLLDRDHNTKQSWNNSSQNNLAAHSINGDSFKDVPINPFRGMFSSNNAINETIMMTTSTAHPGGNINYESSNKDELTEKEKHGDVVESGFSFGERMTSFEPTSPVCRDEDSDSDNAIEDIYGTEIKELTTFKSSSATTSRHRILSQRIGQVGYIGQKISPGHIFGALLIEASELRPKPVTVEQAEYVINEDSPVQIDVKWSKPENADKFKSLTYNVQIKPKSGDESWTWISSVKFPVFRVYHTDDKLLLGKVHLSRECCDCTYILRCQAQGEVIHDGVSHLMNGDWSSDICLIFRGYQSVNKDFRYKMVV